MEFVDDSRHLEEQPASLAADAFALSRNREILARKTSANDIDLVTRWEDRRWEMTDIRVAAYFRPVMGEDSVRILVVLHLPPALQTGFLKPGVEAAYARK